MAENNIYSPEDMEKIKQKFAEKKREKTNSGSEIPYDGHIVFEDELEKIKNEAADSKATETNSIEQPPVEEQKPNVVTIPPNGSTDQENESDAIYRDVF